ncbi:MAG: hypothetical protein QW734_04655 [Candidatus Bathyarchaeia archaeon]
MVTTSYTGFYVPLDATPSRIKDEWKDEMLGAREKILNALKTKIVDETSFKNKIATPSSNKWQLFVNPNYLDIDLIKIKQKVKLSGAYLSWKTGIESAFSETGAFPKNVTDKADKFDKVRFTLGAVGVKYLVGWRCAYKAMGAITGDVRILQYLDPNDSLSGDVYNYFPAGIAANVRALGIGIIVQGLIVAEYAHRAGLSSERDAVITAINAKLDDSVEKLPASGNTVSVSIAYDSVADKLKVVATGSTA